MSTDWFLEGETRLENCVTILIIQYIATTGCCNHAHSCILLTPLLPACHNVNRFVASSLFLCHVIFLYSYHILLLC